MCIRDSQSRLHRCPLGATATVGARSAGRGASAHLTCPQADAPRARSRSGDHGLGAHPQRTRELPGGPRLRSPARTGCRVPTH
eukprot:2230266-Alexandrium_andersonii.AAC.1